MWWACIWPEREGLPTNRSYYCDLLTVVCCCCWWCFCFSFSLSSVQTAGGIGICRMCAHVFLHVWDWGGPFPAVEKSHLFNTCEKRAKILSQQVTCQHIESNVIVLEIDESSNRNCWNKYPRCLKKSVWHFTWFCTCIWTWLSRKNRVDVPVLLPLNTFLRPPPSLVLISLSEGFVERSFYLCSNHLVFALKDTCYWEVGFRPCPKVDISMEYLEWSSEDPIMNSNQTDGAVSPASTFLCTSRKICVLV